MRLLSLSPANYVEMLKAEQSGVGFSLSDFGEIIEWGEGNEPPAEVRTRLAATHGANPNFASDMLELAKKALRH